MTINSHVATSKGVTMFDLFSKTENSKKLHVGISNAASYLGVHSRTLRIWDKQGLLVPKRTKSDRRYYTLQDIKDGKVVWHLLKKVSLNIVGVKMLLSALELNSEFSKDKYKAILKIEKHAKITKEMKEENVRKNSKRGRKKKEKEEKKD